MVLQRWEPFRDLRQMEETMNRLWRGFGGTPAYRDGAEDWNILIDVVQQKDDIIVKASIPGVKPEELDISIEDNLLTLKAERKPDIEGKDITYLMQERPFGSFFRALHLPDTVDTNKVKSKYENGVLTLTMPKVEEKKRKQIQIKVSSGTKAIEAKK
ncbi:MAG: Hsp20/alpha crystallin family protein [Dehalococcoidales bacterium]|nr:Hsp20/alpha crystallin family protein [Dehalococcoidales bacterium]